MVRVGVCRCAHPGGVVIVELARSPPVARSAPATGWCPRRSRAGENNGDPLMPSASAPPPTTTPTRTRSTTPPGPSACSLPGAVSSGAVPPGAAIVGECCCAHHPISSRNRSTGSDTSMTGQIRNRSPRRTPEQDLGLLPGRERRVHPVFVPGPSARLPGPDRQDLVCHLLPGHHLLPVLQHPALARGALGCGGAGAEDQ